MVNVVIHVRLAMVRPAMNKYVIKVCLCISTVRAEQLCHQTIKRSRGIGKPLWHNQPLPKHTARSANRCKRDITCSHEQLIITINQIESTVHSTPCHVVLKNVLSRNRCLCRYSGRIKLVISMHNTPLAIRLFDTKCRCGMRRLALTHHSRRVLCTEKRVNDIALLLW